MRVREMTSGPRRRLRASRVPQTAIAAGCGTVEGNRFGWSRRTSYQSRWELRSFLAGPRATARSHDAAPR